MDWSRYREAISVPTSFMSSLWTQFMLLDSVCTIDHHYDNRKLSLFRGKITKAHLFINY